MLRNFASYPLRRSYDDPPFEKGQEARRAILPAKFADPASREVR
jgi:hypothetical protein